MSRLSVHERASVLRDSVFASIDGIITTFAVVAGAQGAGLDSTIVLIIGSANLLADAVSMTIGNYLGTKSEIEYEETKHKPAKDHPQMSSHLLATFFPFVLAGFLPLLPYFFDSPYKFQRSTIMVIMSLFLVGGIRSYYTKRSLVVSGFETVVIGGVAAFVAFGVGRFIDVYILGGA